jgi:SAM-dependent methyltransferase
MSTAAHLLPVLYQTAEQGGWNRGMRAISRALLARDVAAGPWLEVGCGAGEFSAEIYRSYPPVPLYGVDLHPLALPYAQQKEPGLRLSQSDLHHLPFPAETFATVLAFDALDQKGVDTRAALAESWRVLRPQGRLLLRVSAYPWLLGAHDVAFGTGQRFSHRALGVLLQQSHFDVVRMTYANTTLALPIILVRLLQRWQWLPFTPESYGAAVEARWLERILRVEARWLARRNFPFGISLYAVARKPVISYQ